MSLSPERRQARESAARPRTERRFPPCKPSIRARSPFVNMVFATQSPCSVSQAARRAYRPPRKKKRRALAANALAANALAANARRAKKAPRPFGKSEKAAAAPEAPRRPKNFACRIFRLYARFPPRRRAGPARRLPSRRRAGPVQRLHPLERTRLLRRSPSRKRTRLMPRSPCRRTRPVRRHPRRRARSARPGRGCRRGRRRPLPTPRTRPRTARRSPAC